ncbi:SurA N-terminal domain-containing protein [Tepidamorphus sp. 3E244]|uniref:SurA N-terminal domain-containing protein n=1 Tax=Tepidamorphus sp. 3E244 TaxID=3385498 RepID=UPI0038FC0624
MMDALRRGAKSWVAKFLLIILAGSFALWGVADVLNRTDEATLITIGETKIPGEQYRYELQNEMQNFGRRLGRPITLQEARVFGIDRQVLGRLITQASLDEKARSMGLNMSDDAIAEAIRNDPQFQTPGGQFDQSYFQQVLRASGRSEAGYVAEKRREMLRQAIGNGLTAGTPVSETLRDLIHAYSNEARSFDYFVLTKADTDEIAEPTPEELQTYFDANTQRFAAPEYRSINIIAVDPEALTSTIEVTEDELQTEYDIRKADYSTPERREVRQIVFAEREEAEAAAGAIADGKSFEDVATERGLARTETELGLVAKGDIVDPTVADAAFALNQGEVSDVIEGQFGFVIATVDAIQEGSERSFEDARAELEQSLKLARAETAVLDMFDKVEDARAGGQTLAEIAEANGLELVTIEKVDAAGNGPDGNQIENLPAGQELLREAFATDVGLENDPIQQRGTSFVWFDVTDIEPGRDRTLDEVRDRVAEAWRAEQEANALSTAAQSAVEAINNGEKITAVAGQYGKSVTSARPVKRNETSAPAGSSAVERLFLLPQGRAAQAPTAEGGNRIVFTMERSMLPERDPNAEDDKEVVDRIAIARSNDLLFQYVGSLEDEFDVVVNGELLRQLLGEPATN